MILESILVRFLQILFIPHFFRETIWVILPLVFGLVMMQMYFGKYKTEQLGWNTAYANTVSLIWVCFILVKFMSDNYGVEQSWMNMQLRAQLLLIAGVALLTLTLIIMNYNHLLPKKLAFVLSSAVPTSVLAYLAIVIIMGRVPIDAATIWAGLIIWLFVTIVFKIYRRAITAPKDIQRRYEEKQKKQQKERKKTVKKIKQKAAIIVPLANNKPVKRRKKAKRKSAKKRKKR